MIDKLMFAFFLIVSIVAVVIGVQNKAILLIYGGVMYGLLTLYAGSKYMLYKLDNHKMRKKRVFISLPISGQEDTFFARTDAAVLKCQELFEGWDIITPKDINKVTAHMLIDHTEREKTAFYMGRDIEALINSDAIYSCKGWEQSKGCLVERRTAEVYGLELYTEE